MAGESFFGEDTTNEDQRGGIPAQRVKKHLGTRPVFL